MVSIDTVYQKVLVLANKEQRGYITPQDFNLFADHAQMEIFEQYFYDMNQFIRVQGNSTVNSDMVNNLQEKIDIFQVYLSNIEIQSQNGWFDMYDLRPSVNQGIGSDMYRLIGLNVFYDNSVDPSESEYVTWNQDRIFSKSKLLNHFNDINGQRNPGTKQYPTHRKYRNSSMNNLHHQQRIQIKPYPAVPTIGEDGNLEFVDRITAIYTKKPVKPNWAYVNVQDKPFYNSTNSTDFELHASEEVELVYRILALAGIAIEKPQLTQVAAGLESAKVQQEKQ
tara:strand:- start:1199 stop:2038 length:840 start_codon:yes stop_codon:yes gene_type:complete